MRYYVIFFYIVIKFEFYIILGIYKNINYIIFRFGYINNNITFPFEINDNLNLS